MSYKRVPDVSVLMPVRDGGRYLNQAVDSILNQSLSDIELVIVDDNSTDSALQQLPSDPRIHLVPNPGSGIIEALNTGLEQCRGTWLARMDSDDISHPERLRKQRNYLLENPGIDIAGAQVKWLCADDVGGGNARYVEWLNDLCTPETIQQQLLIESPLPHPTWFMKRELMGSLGGYHDAGWAEDYDFLLRADRMGLRMGKPEGILLQWREHSARLTRTDDRYTPEKFTAAKANHLASSCLFAGHRGGVWIWGAGPSGKALYDALTAESVHVKGFLEVHPRRIGGQKRNRPVVHFEQVARLTDIGVLVAVGVPSARPEIRSFLSSLSLTEGRDFLFVA